MSVDLRGFGHSNSVDVATNTTLSLASHSGVVVNVTATCALTLPAVNVAHRFIVRVGGEGLTVTISPDANDKISGAGAANSGAGADNKDVIFTNQPAGSYVVLDYMDANGFTIAESLGSYTFEG
jgi:hypothetical protein